MSSHGWRWTWRRRRRVEPAAPPGTIAIGSGRADRLDIAPKAALLDRAARVGLPVPPGFVIPDERCQTHVVRPAALTPDQRWAVRSAFGAEDDRVSSLAGWFTSLLNVATCDVERAVDEVRASADRHDVDFRRDVLILEMVDARHAGVAFSEPGTYDDVANTATGLADRLVSGQEEGDRFLIPRLERAEAGWQRRLQLLLAGVRAEFGDQPWDVEWADDGETCWLVQIRPITRPTVRDELLTAANHAEILPRLPSQLMADLIAEAGPDLFDWYRRRIPGLPSERDFLHVVEGRPMINLSLLEDMMRHLGLPTALVAESIGGDTSAATIGTDHDIAPSRLIRRSPVLLRLGLAQVLAVARSKRNRAHAASIGAGGASSFTEAVDQLHRSYVTLVTGMFPLSSAIGPPLGTLRRLGTLYEHAARNRTITVELAERRERLRRSSAGSRPTELDRFLTDFGHRGVYESDIARPRYADAPETLDDAGVDGLGIDETGTIGASRPRRTARGIATTPIWLLARAPMRARELFRHDAMRSFHSVRRSLVALADRAVEDGRLDAVDDLWLLGADEVRALDHGWTPGDSFWTARRAERARLADVDVPHVVRRFDDPADWNDADEGDAGPLRGMPLTPGRVTGRAWVLDEPETRRPDGLERDETVLVARSIDAGWISTISDVAAVVVEIGGDLSHGSILVRELGIPAVTNVRGATRRIATGDALLVDAGAGTIRTHDGDSSPHSR